MSTPQTQYHSPQLMTELGYSARVVLQTTNYVMLDEIKLQQNYPKESNFRKLLRKRRISIYS